MNRRLAPRWMGSLAALFGVMAALLATPCAAEPVNFSQRSVSTSRQFIIYCPDTGLRLAVSGYVETAKASVLETLGLRDHWKLPIVVNLERPLTADPLRPLCQVRLFNTDEGTRVEIDIVIHQDQFKEIRFPQQVVRAVLLELAYRDHPPGDNKAYFEPPGWLVEGITAQMQARSSGSGPNAPLFKQLIETGRLPKITDFLASNVAMMDSTSHAIYGAYAFSLVEMLSEMPQGRENLARLVKTLGDSGGDAAAQLLKNFPNLGGSEVALEKWWTLGLARFSASDRYRSLTVAETNNLLLPLLKLEIVTDEKKGTKETFEFADYRKFVKLRTSRPALYARAAALGELLTKAHPLLRPVLTEYQQIAGELARGKTRNVDKSLASIANYRSMIVERMDKISDYLNWFEATQMPERSGAFEGYFKAAEALENQQPRRRVDALSRYVDQVEREFE